jgi:hypothetical protein
MNDLTNAAPMAGYLHVSMMKYDWSGSSIRYLHLQGRLEHQRYREWKLPVLVAMLVVVVVVVVGVVIERREMSGKQTHTNVLLWMEKNEKENSA